MLVRRLGTGEALEANKQEMRRGVQDYGALLRTHRENNADITIATHAVGKKQAYLRGITKVEPDTGLFPSCLSPHSTCSACAWSASSPSSMLLAHPNPKHSLEASEICGACVGKLGDSWGYSGEPSRHAGHIPGSSRSEFTYPHWPRLTMPQLSVRDKLCARCHIDG